MRADRAYEQLLESLADGAPIDWAALSSKVQTGDEHRRYRNMRLVARIAELHRTIPIDDEATAPTAPALDSAGAVPPSAWGHLRIIKRIATGTFGELYLAHDPQLNSDVALKLLRPTSSAQPITARLLDEAQTLAKVRHPNVVTVHGADVREGRAGLWMEFVSGRTLEGWVRSNGVLGPGEAISIGRDVCGALAAVHGAGLVHGDVKAQNVMREEGGRIVLLDFGAGQAQGALKAAAGTPLYLAPEVLAGAPGTVRSDIYSVGVLLFHLLTNRYPFVAADIDGLRAAHAQGDRVRLRDLRPDLPAALIDAVERALDPDPALRFATAGSFERALALRKDRPWPLVAAIGIAAVLALVVAVPEIARQLWGPRVSSVAVLPFSPQQGAEADPVLAGLSTDLVRELQRFDLEVKRATSATSLDDAALERRMGADALVHGVGARGDGATRSLHVSVVRAGASPLWSQDYELDNAAVPTLARTIAEEMASALRINPRASAPTPGHQTNYRAYDAYQRGRILLEQRTQADAMRSLGFFKQAAELDPAYAEPWAGMADAYITLGVSAFGPLSPLEARRLTKQAALEALERNPQLAEAHTSLAFAAFFHDWDWSASETRFKKAIELNPQYPLVHHWYANYLNAMGRQTEAMSEILRARELDPLSIIIHRDVAWHLFFQRRYDEAIAHLEKTLEIDSRYVAARTLLARALAERGRFSEALEHLQEAAAQKMPVGTNLAFVAYVQAISGDGAAADATLQRIRDGVPGGYVPPYYFALVYAVQGRTQDALAELERAYAEQDSTLVSLKVDPRLEKIRTAPGYQALVKRMAFPENNP